MQSLLALCLDFLSALRRSGVTSLILNELAIKIGVVQVFSYSADVIPWTKMDSCRLHKYG